MSATHGLAVSFRRFAIAGVFALALALGAAFASSAKAVVVTHSDLGLGDSLSFGYSQQLFNENEKLGEPPSAFNHGFTNYYFNQSKAKAAGSQLINNGCPGETTDSMIGNGPLGVALETYAEAHGEAPCAYHYAAGLPLHHEYGGTKSQLENALETIAVENAIGKPVTTITFQIGANDELRQVKQCEKEVGEEWGTKGESPQYGGENPTQSFENCLLAHATPLFEHILKNIGAMLYAIRKGEEFGGINYNGKIVVQGFYDPYGNVYGSGEVLHNSNLLTASLNGNEAPVVKNFGACWANPQPIFNPENRREPERLQLWTNMANFTEFEGKKNGPDIHPTPKGYAKLASIMKMNCGPVE